jgi:hypothetical protein
MEPLESRRLLVAEGAVFQLNETIDASGMPSELNATVIWGDGNTSAATVASSRPQSKLRFTIDYSLDTRGFFSGANQSRREVLKLAGELLLEHFTDELTAIVPGGTNTWRASIRHPSAGNDVTPPLHNLPSSLRVAANEIIVYAGSRDFPGLVRGLGGAGGASFSGSTAFVNTVKSRGEAGALKDVPTDFAPSVGSISFDSASSTDWYFGLNSEGIQSGQVDFLSVAIHELTHVLGFGTAPSWQSMISNGQFKGANAVAAYDGSGNVPISGGHWRDGVKSLGGESPLMADQIRGNERRLLTKLDLAALDDMGWNRPSANVNVTAALHYADNGQFPVQIVLRGTDSGQVIGERSFSSNLVTVTNVKPTLTVPVDQSVRAGQAISISDIGLITDPGFRNNQASPPTAENFTYAIDWGDGTEIELGSATIDSHGNSNGALTKASFDGSHTYATAGSKTVNVRVTDDDGGTRQETFRITVAEPAILQLALDRVSVGEQEGEQSAALTISRSGSAIGTSQTVNLRSSDESEAQVFATAIIPANEASISVPVRAIDDALLDGDQDVTLSAAADGWESGTIDLLVRDHESLLGRFSTAQVSEGSATGIQLTVERSNTDTSDPLEVLIFGGISSEVEQPASLTIPANQRDGTVTLYPINDSNPELSTLLSYTLTAPHYVDGFASFELLDNEPPLFQNPVDRFDVNGVDGVQASDALRIINELARRDDMILDPEGEQPSGVYLDVNGDYMVSALDALIVINELPNRESDGQVKVVGQIALAQIDDDDESQFQIDVLPGTGSLF